MSSTNLQQIANEINNVSSNISQSNSLEDLPIILTRIIQIDKVLYNFRDLAGSYLRNGDATIMTRYREEKNKLISLAILCENKYSMQILSKLKCNS